MKKIIILGLVFCSLFITGCGCSKKEKVEILCTKSYEEENLKLDAEYKILYYKDNGEVVKIDENATFISNDDEQLDFFKSLNDMDYSLYSGQKYSDYTAVIEDDKLDLHFEVDFQKISVDEFIDLDYSNNYFVNDGKIDYLKYLEYYESDGFSCE